MIKLILSMIMIIRDAVYIMWDCTPVLEINIFNSVGDVTIFV